MRASRRCGTPGRYHAGRYNARYRRLDGSGGASIGQGMGAALNAAAASGAYVMCHGPASFLMSMPAAFQRLSDPELADIPTIMATIVDERRHGPSATRVSIRAIITVSGYSRWGQNSCSPLTL